MFYYLSQHKKLYFINKYPNFLDYKKSLFIDLYNNLYTLENEYPNFFDWYRSLFNKDYTLKPDREVFLHKYGNDTAGIIILKKQNMKKNMHFKSKRTLSKK